MCRLFRGLAVAAIPWGDGIAVRAGFRMAEEAADALVELRADDVLELAGLVVDFGFFDGKCVFKEPLGETMTPDYVAGAIAAAGGQLRLAISQFDELQFGHATQHAGGGLIRQDREISGRPGGAKPLNEGGLSFFAANPDLLEEMIEADFVIGGDIAAAIGGVDERAGEGMAG